MRIWLDDIRPMPEAYTHWAKSSSEAILLITDLFNPHLERISFDHDLGQPEGYTGYDVATFIERLAYGGLIKRCEWEIHTDNPMGRRRIRQAMESAERFWDMNESRK